MKEFNLNYSLGKLRNTFANMWVLLQKRKWYLCNIYFDFWHWENYGL